MTIYVKKNCNVCEVYGNICKKTAKLDEEDCKNMMKEF